MAVDPEHRIRQQLTNVLLALQLLGRRPRPWDQQQRLARIGIAEARRLVTTTLDGRATTESSQGRESAT